jgi:LmbE family N-acetylglucosaminyl deacetylase
MINEFEYWDAQKKILVILAHPDDPEFFLGGTIAQWSKAGHAIEYYLLTKGERGSSNLSLTADDISKIRIEEQGEAARVLGVKKVNFLDHPDGYLAPDLETRKEVVRIIRSIRPDVLVTCDPLNYFSNRRYINHPDHRAAGQVVIDAVFPAAGNPFYYPELLKEGLEPHTVEEVWMSLTGEPNITLDVSGFWQLRLDALKKHASQIGDPDEFEKRMSDRLDRDDAGKVIYLEKFRRINFMR